MLPVGVWACTQVKGKAGACPLWPAPQCAARPAAATPLQAAALRACWAGPVCVRHPSRARHCARRAPLDGQALVGLADLIVRGALVQAQDLERLAAVVAHAGCCAAAAARCESRRGLGRRACYRCCWRRALAAPRPALRHGTRRPLLRRERWVLVPGPRGRSLPSRRARHPSQALAGTGSSDDGKSNERREARARAMQFLGI